MKATPAKLPLDVMASGTGRTVTSAPGAAVANMGAGNGGTGGGLGASRSRRSRFSCSRWCTDIFNYLLRMRFTPEELEQRYKSREIDKFLEKERHARTRQVSESGTQEIVIAGQSPIGIFDASNAGPLHS